MDRALAHSRRSNLQQGDQTMEGMVPRTDQIRRVERGFEGSRLTEQWISTAYEWLLPTIGRRAAESRQDRLGVPMAKFAGNQHQKTRAGT